MANDNNGNGKGSLTPAYVSYTTFKNFLTGLAVHPVPHQIDSSLMSTYSGATQSQLSTTLRFLGLTREGGGAEPALEAAVIATSDDDTWASVINDELLPCYVQIVQDIDIERATPAELDGAFRKYGADGSVLTKAVRFYLKLLADAGVESSPHFKKTRRSRTGSPRRTRRRKPLENGGDDPKVLRGMISIPLYFKGRQQGELRVPSDFNEIDIPVVTVALEMAKVYAAQEGGNDG